jgi:hypothetical protein
MEERYDEVLFQPSNLVCIMIVRALTPAGRKRAGKQECENRRGGEKSWGMVR